MNELKWDGIIVGWNDETFYQNAIKQRVDGGLSPSLEPLKLRLKLQSEERWKNAKL